MDVSLFLMLLVPIVVALVSGFYLHHAISIKEAFLLFLITAAVIAGTWAVGRYSSASDYEIWNGEVTRKEAIQRNCPYGWRSSQDSFCTEYRTRTVQVGESCSTDDKGNRTCSPIYDTEYNYIYSWEKRYFVWTNVKADFEVPRVDRQGVKTPPRFTKVFIGEPASSKQPYDNWIRAASDNLFHEDGKVEELYTDLIPEYPIKIYDMYKVDRVVALGNVKYPATLNDDISHILRKLGPQRQMNFVLVLVDTQYANADIAYAIQKKWRGFKKNDAVVVLGLNENKMEWVNVFSWSKKSIFNINLRNSILEQQGKEFNFAKLISDVDKYGMEDYERRSMKEFEYLKNDIPVPTWLLTTGFILSFILSFGLVIVFSKTDL